MTALDDVVHDKRCEAMIRPPDANPMHDCHCRCRAIEARWAEFHRAIGINEAIHPDGDGLA
jgi:hypothetical protein